MAAFAEQRPSQVEACKDKKPAEVYHGHLIYTATINGKCRVATVKFVDPDGEEYIGGGEVAWTEREAIEAACRNRVPKLRVLLRVAMQCPCRAP